MRLGHETLFNKANQDEILWKNDVIKEHATSVKIPKGHSLLNKLLILPKLDLDGINKQ